MKHLGLSQIFYSSKTYFIIAVVMVTAAVSFAVNAEIDLPSGSDPGYWEYDPGPLPIPTQTFEWQDRGGNPFTCGSVAITVNGKLIADNLPCKGSYVWQPETADPFTHEIRYRTGTQTVCKTSDPTCGYREAYDVSCQAPSSCSRAVDAGEEGLDLVSAKYGVGAGPIIIKEGKDEVFGPLKLVTESLPKPLLGKYYYVAIEAEGGRGSYEWTVTGAFPPGLTNGPTPCVIKDACQNDYLIKGTPSKKGLYTFTVSVSDGTSSLSKTYTLVISSSEPAKLVEIGWDTPQGYQDVKAYLGVLESKKFDAGNFIHKHFQFFSKGALKFTYEQMKEQIDGINAVRTPDSKPMFVQIDTAAGMMGYADLPDWFNDEHWKNTLNNVRLISRLGKEAGFKGVVVDPEDYSGPEDPTQGARLWNYSNRPDKGTKTFPEYAKKVYERGRQFIQTINSEFPNIPVITYWCFEAPTIYAADARARYSLLPAFCDGMIQAADEGTVIHNATENGYMFTTEADFINYKDQAYSLAKQFSINPARLDTHFRVGFGIWPRTSRYSAASWENMVTWALKHSEGYVWTYTEKQGWWVTRHITAELPQGYQDSQFKAREKHLAEIVKAPVSASVSSIEPENGPAGSVFTLKGTFPAGSSVVVNGETLPSEANTANNELAFRIPSTYPSGTYSAYVVTGQVKSGDIPVRVSPAGSMRMASGPQLPRAFTAIPGSVNVPVGSLSITAQDESVVLNQLGFRFTAKDLASIQKFTVWDGAQKIVEGVPGASVTIPVRNVFVPRGLNQILTVTVDIAEAAEEDSITLRYEPTTTYGTGQLSRGKIYAAGPGGRMGGTVRVGEKTALSLSIHSPLLVKPSGATVSYFLNAKNFSRTELRFICDEGISTRDKNLCGLDQALESDGIVSARFDNSSGGQKTVYARYRGFDAENNVAAQRTIPVRITASPLTATNERTVTSTVAGIFFGVQAMFSDLNYFVRDVLFW